MTGQIIFILEIILYGLTLWLGSYLIVRSQRGHGLYLTGIGLCIYALALASGLLTGFAVNVPLAAMLIRLQWIFLSLPAFFWAGAILRLSDFEHTIRPSIRRGLDILLSAAGLTVVALLLVTDLIVNFSQGGIVPTYPFFALLVVIPLAVGLGALRFVFPGSRQRGAYILLIVAGLLFTTSIVLLLLPIGWLPSNWVILAGGVDLFLLGLAISVLDAYEEGEAVLPDMVRSLQLSVLAAVVFGGQVLLLIFLVTGLTFGALLLLLGTIAAAILWQTMLEPVQSALDRIAFRTRPELAASRAELRTEGRILTRVDTGLNPVAVDEKEFARLTRRALSHYNDLPRLASSPLTRLPIIETRLAERGVPGETLESAAELKAVLSESIEKLKPRGKGAFGTTDDWRYYNALHFPYVVGLKPYSRSGLLDGLNETDREAMEWFRTMVPERTLYNWQTAAARLVAQDLRERSNWQ